MSTIDMVLHATHDWSTVEKAQEFVDVLVSEGEFLRPQKFGDREPERFRFDPYELTKFFELWTSDTKTALLYLRRHKPYPAWMSVKICFREQQQFNEIMGEFDQQYLTQETGIDTLLSCAKRLYGWGAVAHGYICHKADWYAKNYFGKPTRVQGGRVVYAGGVWLKESLPGVYWANFFGPLYVDFLSREKFRTVPAYHKEELPDGGYLLLTAPSPLDYNRRRVRMLERRIIKHLGRDAFFEKAYPLKLCRTPQFTFTQKEFGGSIVSMTYDAISEAIPDVYRFLQDAPQLAEALSSRFKEPLDYSPESLKRVDDFILRRSYRRPKPCATAAGRHLLQELTAYYGEVLRRHRQGEWLLLAGSSGKPHPVVAWQGQEGTEVEYPFTRVDRLWIERERANGLATRSYLLLSGQQQQVEQFLKNLE